MPEAEIPDTRWAALGVFEPLDLVDATAELHWAIQLLASAGQTFAEPSGDDRHRAVVWAAELSAFVGAPFAAAYPLRVAIRPADLTLLILDRTGEAVAVLPLPGESLDEAHEWIGLAAATYLGGAPPLLERPEYDMPVHPLQNGARFSTAIRPELGALAALYGSAAEMIETVVSERSDASDILCWPHHFDIASLLTVQRDQDGEATKTIGVGLAPAGAGISTWYWYVSPWPAPDPAALPPLDVGGWSAGEWTGAVLEGEAVTALPPAERAEAVRAFLRSAIEASFTALG